MLLSIALILLTGMLGGRLCRQLGIPSLFGMILTGILLGPGLLNLIDGSILQLSAQLRRIALIIILTRAGLSLNLEDLKKVGRPAVLMCFVPASLEMLGMTLLGPRLLGIGCLDAAIIGAVCAAVSPAVIVPKMLRLMEEGYGTEARIPQLILAGASVDDVFVIVMFSALTGLAQGERLTALRFAQIPLSIVSGSLVGLLFGYALHLYFRRIHLRDTAKVIIMLSLAFLLVSFEDAWGSRLPFASLIAVMCVGIALQQRRPELAARLAQKYNKLWVAAEIILFVLVGSSVDVHYLGQAGISALLLIVGALVFRMAGVWLCLLGTDMALRERVFCMLAYTPKATVQAAIGGIPMAMGLPGGPIVLTVAVLAILFTAPLGALGIELSYTRLLQRSFVSI